MYGGTIENCNASEGAAVYVDDSGDGPGYFYMKGGTKKEEGGESKAVIHCAAYNGNKTKNAIYNYGYFGIEGVIDIEGIVYLHQNNWASTTKHFIKVTDRLVVVGDGYIDIDSAYPNSNAVCTGHTVIENATQTEGTSQNPISQEEFYTYSSYFINSTKGLMISAGFDPTKNEMAGKEYPSNWPSYQADLYSRKYTYKDVKGQTMLIQASDSPGDKRQMQNYNYLIYTERDKLEEDYAVYYSIKISKRDIGTDDRLNGAVFSLKKKNIAEDGTVRYEDIGISGTTGMEEDGVAAGETYIYLDAEKMGKLMVDDDILAFNSASQVIAAANECDGGIVLCGYRLTDMHYSELYGYLPREFQMLLVASPAKLQECSIGSIMCLAMPIHSHELVSTIETMAMELYAAEKRKRRYQPRKRSEKEQKSIDDAKALLMERNHLSEEEAHKYIQKLSMDSGNNLVETAEMILAFD